MRFQALIDSLESRSGVYLMLSSKAEPIYIGKAKDLKKRLKSYFVGKPSSHRIGVMLTQVVDLKVMITDSEAAALVLENKLIKSYQPKYNILLKDDKSFPYLVFSKHDFPRLLMKRSKQKTTDNLYGPYTNKKEARHVLDQIQRVFRIRNCSDHFFRNRTRPCIQYEIGRCTAPCVGFIDESAYKADVKAAKKVLLGKSSTLHKEVTHKMYQYADEEDFERAAACRDLLKSLASVSAETKPSAFMHVFDTLVLGHQVVIVKMEVIDGQVAHTSCECISTEGKCLDQEWLFQYIYHHYQLFNMPKSIIVPASDVEVLKEALGGNVVIQNLAAKKYEDLARIARDNIQAYLKSQSSEMYQWHVFWRQLEDYCQRTFSHILCVDVSHHQGSATYVSVVFCSANGMERSRYRTYKVSCDGDDYEAIRQGLQKKLRSGGIDESTLLIIDGGRGQLSAAKEVVSMTGAYLTCASKGPKREWGREKYYRDLGEVEQFQWPEDMMRYILHIRDEAHNTAINMHRRALRKLSLRSILDSVEGIGSQKKKAVMEYFGGLEQLRYAKLEDIEKVPGVGKALAKRIHTALHIEP